LKAPSLTPEDKEQAWGLLLDTYHRTGAPERSTLSKTGFKLCSARFAAGDRDPRLLAVLTRALMGRRQFDREGREIYLRAGAEDSPDGVAARHAAVRCDARLREFSPNRLAWYREAFAGGSLSAGLLLTAAAVRGRLPAEAGVAAAVRRCLAELSAEQWQSFGLSAQSAKKWLANWFVSPEAGPPTSAAVVLVAEQLGADPDNLAYLRYLAAAWRPRLDAAAVGVYERLFHLDRDDLDNATFLSEAVLRGDIVLADPYAVLARRLSEIDDPDARLAFVLALARAAAQTERDDDEAVRWVEEAAALPEALPLVRGWRAVCRARRGDRSTQTIELCAASLFDQTLAPAWRGEAGLAVLADDQTRGVWRPDIAEAVWHCLPAESRPDDLTLALARRCREEHRTDGAAAAIYRRAYELAPEPELARLLATAYLADEETPVRDKIAHWRACLDRGEAEPAVVEALARAYASLGSATEAAIYVAGNAPEGQQPRLLDDLCRYRFRRGDYAAAETLAAALQRLRPDDPEVTFKLLGCRVRRRLAEGRSLDDIETAQARAQAIGHLPLARLLDLVAAARDPLGDGEHDVATAGALGAIAPAQSAFGVAAAALGGRRVNTAGVMPRSPEESWLLALAEHVAGRPAAAEQWLNGLAAGPAAVGRALVGARAAAAGGAPGQALALLAAIGSRSGPPWDQLRAVRLDLVMRHGSAQEVARWSAQMEPAAALAAELRLVAELDAAGDPGALDRLAEVETATHPEAVGAMRHSLQARQVYRLLEEGELGRADELLTMLSEPVGGHQPLPGDCRHWLRALLGWQQLKPDLAWNSVARLSPQARSRRAVAWTTAAWHLAEGALRRAEAELSHALRWNRDDPELLYAVVSLDACCGRAEKFLGLVGPLLGSLATDDPRRSDLELLQCLLSAPLADVELGGWFERPGQLAARDLRLRLRATAAVVAARIRAGRLAEAGALVSERLGGLTLPAELAPTVAELRNLGAFAAYLAGDQESAASHLARLGNDLAVRHNAAVVAEAAGRLEEALKLREENLGELDSQLFEVVGGGYREAVVFAAHAHCAELYLRLEQWRTGLAHLEACLKTRPYDIATQRKCIPALIAVGESDVALHKSAWLLSQRPNDLEILLEHATVLVSCRGARAAIEYLDELAKTRPDAVDAVRQRKYELRERLMENAQQRAKEHDFMGLFTLSREVEQLAESDEERARAILQQAYGLSHMAGHGEKAAVLEQAYGRCEEALKLDLSDRTAGQLGELRDRIAQHLAPELLRQADGLMKHRRKAFMTLTENLGAPPPDARTQVAALGQAFGRIAQLAQRAAALGDAGAKAEAAALVTEAERLGRDCRRLEGGL
jgi:hypothetical protein